MLCLPTRSHSLGLFIVVFCLFSIGLTSAVAANARIQTTPNLPYQGVFLEEQSLLYALADGQTLHPSDLLPLTTAEQPALYLWIQELNPEALRLTSSLDEAVISLTVTTLEAEIVRVVPVNPLTDGRYCLHVEFSASALSWCFDLIVVTATITPESLTRDVPNGTDRMTYDPAIQSLIRSIRDQVEPLNTLANQYELVQGPGGYWRTSISDGQYPGYWYLLWANLERTAVRFVHESRVNLAPSVQINTALALPEQRATSYVEITAASQRVIILSEIPSLLISPGPNPSGLDQLLDMNKLIFEGLVIIEVLPLDRLEQGIREGSIDPNGVAYYETDGSGQRGLALMIEPVEVSSSLTFRLYISEAMLLHIYDMQQRQRIYSGSPPNRKLTHILFISILNELAWHFNGRPYSGYGIEDFHSGYGWPSLDSHAAFWAVTFFEAAYMP